MTAAADPIVQTARRQRELVDVFSPTRFGAKGDGSHDDTQAVIDCLAAACASRSKSRRVVFPAGDWAIDRIAFNRTDLSFEIGGVVQPGFMDDGIRLEITSEPGAVIRARSADTTLLDFTGTNCSHLWIHDLTLVGFGSSTSQDYLDPDAAWNGDLGIGIAIRTTADSFNVHIHDIVLSEFGYNAMFVGGPLYESSLKNIKAINTGQDGIVLRYISPSVVTEGLASHNWWPHEPASTGGAYNPATGELDHLGGTGWAPDGKAYCLAVNFCHATFINCSGSNKGGMFIGAGSQAKLSVVNFENFGGGAGLSINGAVVTVELGHIMTKAYNAAGTVTALATNHKSVAIQVNGLAYNANYPLIVTSCVFTADPNVWMNGQPVHADTTAAPIMVNGLIPAAYWADNAGAAYPTSGIHNQFVWTLGEKRLIRGTALSELTSLYAMTVNAGDTCLYYSATPTGFIGETKCSDGVVRQFGRIGGAIDVPINTGETDGPKVYTYYNATSPGYYYSIGTGSGTQTYSVNTAADTHVFGWGDGPGRTFHGTISFTGAGEASFAGRVAGSSGLFGAIGTGTSYSNDKILLYDDGAGFTQGFGVQSGIVISHLGWSGDRFEWRVSSAGASLMTLGGGGNITFTGNMSLGGHTIANVTDPTQAQDAATKAYVDAQAGGARDVKESVRAKSTVSVTISNPATSTFDGVVLSSDDRVLLTDQSTASQNGLYLFNGISSAMTRTTDADTSAEVTAGLYVWVTEGTSYADTGWLLTTNDPITLASTSLAFTQVSSLGQVTAGAGLTKSGSTLTVGAGTGITVNADDVAINTTIVPTKNASNTFTQSNQFTDNVQVYGTLEVDTLLNVQASGTQATFSVNSGQLTISGTGNVTTTGAITATGNLQAGNFIQTVGITVDGGGSVITTGSKGYRIMEVGGTITSWEIIGDQSGSVVFDVKRSSNFPSSSPASIVGGGGNKPTLSSAQKNSAAPASWTSVTLAAGDVIEFNVDSVTTCTRVTLQLKVKVT